MRSQGIDSVCSLAEWAEVSTIRSSRVKEWPRRFMSTLRLLQQLFLQQFRLLASQLRHSVQVIWALPRLLVLLDEEDVAFGRNLNLKNRFPLLKSKSKILQTFLNTWKDNLNVPKGWCRLPLKCCHLLKDPHETWPSIHPKTTLFNCKILGIGRRDFSVSSNRLWLWEQIPSWRRTACQYPWVKWILERTWYVFLLDISSALNHHHQKDFKVRLRFKTWWFIKCNSFTYSGRCNYLRLFRDRSRRSLPSRMPASACYSNELLRCTPIYVLLTNKF